MSRRTQFPHKLSCFFCNLELTNYEAEVQCPFYGVPEPHTEGLNLLFSTFISRCLLLQVLSNIYIFRLYERAVILIYWGTVTNNVVLHDIHTPPETW